MTSRVLILCLWLLALDAQAALIEAVVQIPVEVTDEHRSPHPQQICRRQWRQSHEAAGKSVLAGFVGANLCGLRQIRKDTDVMVV